MNTTETRNDSSSVEFPFEHELIPVMKGFSDFKEFVAQYPGFTFCPYLADKTTDEWAVSTSRRYMNRVLPNFIYVPVNIADKDLDMLTECVKYADQNPAIAAVNITKPHKSAPALRKLFFGDDSATQNVDTLIKSNMDSKLHPFDLNAPAFVNWFEEDVEEFEDKTVVIIGVGGVGEPVAKHIDEKRPASIYLVDIKDRSDLETSLTSETHFYHHLSDIHPDLKNMVVINASGKDGISDDTGLIQFLDTSPRNVFVDLRPHLHIDIVEKAKELGWKAYTGNSMNARNDYELLTGIMDYLDIKEEARPTFTEFEQKVTEAS